MTLLFHDHKSQMAPTTFQSKHSVASKAKFSPISAFTNKYLLEQNHAHLSILLLFILFYLYYCHIMLLFMAAPAVRQSYEIVTESR